jgi:hypothetical protein
MVNLEYKTHKHRTYEDYQDIYRIF